MRHRPVDHTTLKNIASIINQAIAEEKYSLWFVDHAEDRMVDDGIDRIDIVEVLRDCIISSCRRARWGKWRYVAEGKTLDGLRLAVVVELGEADEEGFDLLVITVWIIE